MPSLPAVLERTPVSLERTPLARTFLPEVHGLRALAILLVVVYHLAPAALPGGFVGVDVFFVISGFLMTRQMRGEIERTGRLRLGAFYAGRARRILPAALVTIVVVVAAGLALLPPTRWAELGAQARASTLFWQNWQLAAGAVDYLAQGQAPTPFQHFWSLAVEEQFYLLWPLVLLAAFAARRRPARRLLARRRPARGPVRLPTSGRRRALALTIAAVLVSFTVCVAWTATGSPAAYFATPARLWELGAGAVLALRTTSSGRGGRAPRAATSWTGCLAIGAAAVCFDSATPFPGAAAALPVLGACAVIGAGGSGARASFERIAGGRPVRWLGDISYSLYLWHWPVIVLWPFAVPLALPDPVRVPAQVAVSLALAALSRRFVERPAQRSVTLRSAPRVTGLVAVLALLLVAVATLVPAGLLGTQSRTTARAVEAFWAAPPAALGAAAIDAGGYRAFDAGTRLIVPDPRNARADLPTGVSERCKSAMADDVTPRCEFGPATASITIALVGDSHAEQYVPALEVLAARHVWRVRTYLHASCPFSTAERQTDRARGGPCVRANEATLAALERSDDVDVVITSQRTAVPFVDDGSAPSPVAGFVELWGRLGRAGRPVIAIRDNPMMLPDDGTQDCLARALADPDSCARTLADAVPDDAQVEAAQRLPAVTLADLTTAFCVDGRCPPVIGNVLVYRDDQHLTATYVRTLAPRLEAVISGVLDARAP
jgi:peptidoglycan/LPS O-acetylase OafA/YrhL